MTRHLDRHALNLQRQSAALTVQLVSYCSRHGGVHAAMLRAPPAQGRRANAMLTAQFGNRQSAFGLAQDRKVLLFDKFRHLHQKLLRYPVKKILRPNPIGSGEEYLGAHFQIEIHIDADKNRIPICNAVTSFIRSRENRPVGWEAHFFHEKICLGHQRVDPTIWPEGVRT